MKFKRYKEIEQHMQYFEEGTPLKDYENVEQLVVELWDEFKRLQELCNARAALCTAYRLQDNQRVEKALSRIEAAIGRV